MAETILTSPIFTEVVLPFVLIFTVVFAILQKTQILGKGKKQIDAIVSLSMGLIVVSYANAVNIISDLMPFLAISIVIILVFLLLYGMVFREGQFDLDNKVKHVIGGLSALALIVVVLYITGAWSYIQNNWLGGETQSSIVTNAIFLVIVALAIGIAMSSGKKNEDSD